MHSSQRNKTTPVRPVPLPIKTNFSWETERILWWKCFTCPFQSILYSWWPFFYVVKNASNKQSNDIITTRQMILPDNYLTKTNNIPQESPA